jgi:hypothetical protein
MNEFTQQLMITVIDNLVIGLLLAIAGYWFGKLLERYRTDQSKILEQFKTDQQKAIEQLRGEQALFQEYVSLRDEVKHSHLQRQIQELYGPLHGLLVYGKSINEIEHQTVSLAPKEQDTGLIRRYFYEKYYLPLNSQISELIRTKLYLLETEDIPESFNQFLIHAAQFECLHNLWRDLNIKSDHISGIEYPKTFRQDVQMSLANLRTEYNRFVNILN